MQADIQFSLRALRAPGLDYRIDDNEILDGLYLSDCIGWDSMFQHGGCHNVSLTPAAADDWAGER
jgi:hypothetical protein